MTPLLLLTLAAAPSAEATRGVSPDPAALAVPAEDAARARALVRRLGSAHYRERERAYQELREMGRRARAALADALADPDPEVRARCGRLLPDAADDEFTARLAAFVADADAAFDHDLPGWDLFRRACGGDPPARGLFAAAVRDRTNRDLLTAAAHAPAGLPRAIAERRHQFYVRAYPRPVPGAVRPAPQMLAVADVAALLLAESRVANRDVPRLGGSAVTASSFIQPTQGAVIAAARGTGPHADPFRRLLLFWMDSRTAPDELSQVVGVVSVVGLTDGLRHVRRAMAADGTTPFQRANAATVAARLGGRDELPGLTALFPQDGLVLKNQIGAVQVETRVRDVALAMALLVTEQSPKDYGFEVMPAGEGPSRFSYWNYGFADDGKRHAAFKKWEQWEAGQKKK